MNLSKLIHGAYVGTYDFLLNNGLAMSIFLPANAGILVEEKIMTGSATETEDAVNISVKTIFITLNHAKARAYAQTL